jgi:hypothetical protein
MAYILFLDESGIDMTDSPYPVIAGLSIEDKSIWNLIKEVRTLEESIFGRRYGGEGREIKGSKLLKTKTYRLAKQLSQIDPNERLVLAKECLDNGNHSSYRHYVALAQAKIAFVEELLWLTHAYQCKIFACMLNKKSDFLNNTDVEALLRKDYVFLFEKFFFYLEDKPEKPAGIMVFDEIGKQNSTKLITLTERYFKNTYKGRLRSSLLIPEPLFVHSDLTTGIQIADIVAYILSWAFRIKDMVEPIRTELNPLLEILLLMRYRTEREMNGVEKFELWSVSYIN